MNSILITTDFNIGETVCAKLDTEAIYMVTGYLVNVVNEAGEVQNVIIKCSNGEGETFYLYEYELKKVEVAI